MKCRLFCSTQIRTFCNIFLLLLLLSALQRDEAKALSSDKFIGDEALALSSDKFIGNETKASSSDKFIGDEARASSSDKKDSLGDKFIDNEASASSSDKFIGNEAKASLSDKKDSLGDKFIGDEAKASSSDNKASSSDKKASLSEKGEIIQYNPGDLAWVLTSTALVLLMIPGIGYLYSGIARRKNSLHLLLMSLAGLAVVYLQWFLFGYSLAFSTSSKSSLIGNMEYVAFVHVHGSPVAATNNRLPEILFASFEGAFAALVPAIAIGAACERSRVLPFLVFIFFWTTFVYDFTAYWIFNPNGWAAKWGVYDFAGGGPVEINSGITGLVISYYLGPRHGFGTNRLLFKPHNIAHVFLGTVFLWFGWLGFNGGSAFGANIRAAMAITVTNIAASSAGIAWMILDNWLQKTWSVVGFCTGSIAGLVAITPASGFVGIPAAALIGVVSAVVSNLATYLKGCMRIDDVMDIFSVHGLAGFVGLIMTGIFAQKVVAQVDGDIVIKGGWLDGNFKQLGLQIAYSLAVSSWCAAFTYVLMLIIDYTPYIGPFRCSADAELVGLDEDQMGEFAYDFEFSRNTPSSSASDQITAQEGESITVFSASARR